jgi:hypothetical protein
MPFNGHSYLLCLDYKLYLAAIKYQADHGLGKAYTGMSVFVEGLHSEGYLSDADYEVYKAKYSVGLAEGHKSPTQIHVEQSRAAERKTVNKHFGEVLSQWSGLKDSAKQYHLKEAEKHKTLKNAKLLLDLAKPQTLEAPQ